jgi:hypothetical protein
MNTVFQDFSLNSTKAVKGIIPHPPPIASMVGTPRSVNSGSGAGSAKGSSVSSKRNRRSNSYISPQQFFETLCPPISAALALRHFQSYLSDYEQAEILEFQKVYFLGLEAEKPRTDMRNGHNYGFDDDKGDYHIIIGDHIEYRYEIL